MKKDNMRTVAQLALLVLPLLVLPGCGMLDWVKEKLGMSQSSMMGEMEVSEELDLGAEKKTKNEINATDFTADTLIKIGGKSVVSMKDLEAELEQLIVEYPELKQVLPMMPDAKRNLLKGMLSQIIVDEWSDRNLSKDAEFKKEKARMCKQAERVVNQKYFSKHHPVEITDAELKSFYDKHKNMMPDLMISRGGVNAVGIKFKEQAPAQAFLAAIKDGNLSNVAAAQGMAAQVREFKDIDKMTPGVDQAIREALVGMKSFPTTQIVKAGNDIWVLQGLSKDEPKYQEFSKVKDMLKPAAEQEKRMEHLESLIEKYKKQYNVEINEDAVKPDESALQRGMPASFGEMEEEEMPMAPQPA